ncbi:hypothetical protein PFISCL1PPCAC_708, partial [Pristionchus fissidentatus]
SSLALLVSGSSKMPGHRDREHRRRADEQPPRKHRHRSHKRASPALSEEVNVSPSKSVVAPSLPNRSVSSYYTDVNSQASSSDATLCLDNPSAVCPSLRMNEHDRKTTYQLNDGSLLTILERANAQGKTIALKLLSGEQVFVERVANGNNSLMMVDRKGRVVHAVGTDWKEPEAVHRA